MADPLARDQLTDRTLAAWCRHGAGESVDADALLAELSDGTLPEALHRAATAAGERPALDVEGDAISHAELDARAARVGGWLREQGVVAGDRVVLTGPSSIELVCAYVGLLRAGAAMVPVDPAGTEAELRHVVQDSGAVGAWAAGEALGHLSRIAGSDGTLRLVGGLDGDEAEPASLARAAADGPALDVERAPGDALAMLAYTSGTTGRPKGVPLTHANLLSSIRAVMLAWRWSADDVLVHALPLSHQHGLGGVHATLLAGSRAVLLARFDAARVCEAIARERATVLFAVPAMYERLATPEALGSTDSSSLRLAVSGSAPLSPAVAERAAEALGEPPLERYGSTESGLSVSNPHDGPRKVGSVGLPLPGTELAIVDGDGRPVQDGDDGEIVLRGPPVFAGYWRLPDATGDAFLEGGWFRTGDLGRIDPDDGYLAITGRSKELIISGGLNVYPREVELALEQHPDVERVAVAGVPSERWGEEVVAFVVAEGEIDGDALITHCRERLSAYKCPKRVVSLSELPVNRMGKVRRDALPGIAAGVDGQRA